MSDPVELLTNPSNVPVPISSTGFIDRTIQSLSSNPLFSAGAGLAGLGLLAQLGRRALIIGNAIARRKFISKLQITNEEP